MGQMSARNPEAPAVRSEIPQAICRPEWITATLRHRLYPAAFQWITTVLFLVIVVSVLFGTNNSGQNFGMGLTWTVWWPLLPLSFLLAGRFWCAICPFAWLTDQVQRVVGVRLPVPRVLRRYGPWVIAALFLLITYVDETWRLSVDARRTGYLLLAVLVAVVFFAAFYERRTFCRYVCFIGGFAANYSRAGMLALRSSADRCRSCHQKSCYTGTGNAPGCPVFLLASAVEDSADCHLCGTCVKNCPSDAIRVSLRPPTAELWGIRQPRWPDTVLAAIVVGVVLLEQAVLLREWIPFVEATGRHLHVDPYLHYPIVYAVTLAAFAAAPLAGLVVAGLLAQAIQRAPRPREIWQNVLVFGYALIPLALASHVAHSADVLLTRSRAVPFTFLTMVERAPGAVQAAWLSNAAVFDIELVILALGAVGSLYTGYRLARLHAPRSPVAAYLPHAALMLVCLAANAFVVLTLLQEKG